MTPEVNQEITVMLRSLVGPVVLFLVTVTFPAFAAPQSPPTIDEVAGYLRHHSETISYEPARLNFLQSLLFMLPWEISSQEMDRLYADIAQVADRQAYDSFYWVEFHSRMADVLIARGKDEQARQILRGLERLGIGKDRHFSWRECNIQRTGCSSIPFAYLYRDIAYAYLRLGDKEDALRVLEKLVEVELGSVGQEHYPDGFWRISRVVREYIKLGETQLAQSLFERAVAAFVASNEADKSDQADLIGLAVRLEHHENPQATEVFEEAIRYFQTTGSRFGNRRNVDGRTDLFRSLYGKDFQAKEETLHSLIYNDLKNSRNHPGWQETLEVLLRRVPLPEMQVDLIKLYKNRLGYKRTAKQKPTRTLWTPLSDIPLSHKKLFNLQVWMKALTGAEETFSWLLENEHEAVGHDEIMDLAILNARFGKRERALELLLQGQSDIAGDPGARSYRKDDKLKSASAFIHIQLGSSLLTTDRSQAEEHLFQAWVDIRAASAENLDLGLYRALIRIIRCHEVFNPEDVTLPIPPARSCLLYQ